MRRDKKIPRVKLEEQHAPRRAGVQFGDFVGGSLQYLVPP